MRKSWSRSQRVSVPTSLNRSTSRRGMRLSTELVRASRAAALLRMRVDVGLVGDEEAFEAQYRLACKAAAACHPDLRDEATHLLETCGA